MNKITKHTKIYLKRLSIHQKKYISLLFLKNIKATLKKTWEIIKEAIGKTKMKGSDFQRKLSI